MPQSGTVDGRRKPADGRGLRNKAVCNAANSEELRAENKEAEWKGEEDLEGGAEIKSANGGGCK